MAFELLDATQSDFPALMRCRWDAFETPAQPFHAIFCPLNAVISTGSISASARNRDEAIQESVDRYWHEHGLDPSSRWQKVVEATSGRVVGGALWKFNTRSLRCAEKDVSHDGENGNEEWPLPPEPAVVPYWHPEGGQRDFATQVLAAHGAARRKWATRPHLYLNSVFVDPKFQGHGIASLVLSWGVERAEELHVEMWLDALNEAACRVYERHGFTTVEHSKIEPTAQPPPDEAWKAYAEKCKGLEEWVMWRPNDGPYVQGKSTRPWEVA